MANPSPSPNPAPAPKIGRRWLRLLGIIVGVLVLLLVVVYFVGTSSGFLTGVILPKVSKSVNANITVKDASISPFKQVILHDLKVQAEGQEPLLTAPEVRLRYSLMDIIGGNIHVDEITVTSPSVTLVQNADGSSNLDPLLKAQQNKPKEAETKSEKKSSKPPQIDLKHFALTDATVRRVKLYKNGNRDVAELSHVNVTLDDLKNGQTGKLTLGADIKMENNPPAPETNGVLEAKLKGNFDFALTQDLKPASIKGNTHMEVTRAAGALADAATFGTDLNCEVTPTDIKQVALVFKKGDTSLGELRVQGPFDMEKTEGHITVQLLSIDKRLLNIAGAKSGLDFGPTTISASNDIQLAKSGKLVTATGRFDINKLQVTRTNQTTPTLDLNAQYDVSVDSLASNAVLRVCNLTGNQAGKPMMKAELTSPMSFSWGNSAAGAGDSSLVFTIIKLNLADWKPFLGDSVSTGLVDTKLKLDSKQGGKSLTFDLDTLVDNLTAGAGSNKLDQATVTVKANGKADDFKKYALNDYTLQVAQKGQKLITASASGTADQVSKISDFQLTAQCSLPALLKAMPQPDVQFSSGTIDLKSHITQKQDNTTVTGNFALTSLNGHASKSEFHDFGTTADMEIFATTNEVQIRKMTGKITEGANAGGSFDVTGNYNLNSKAAQLTAKLVDLNQNALHAFLQPALQDKKLVSIAINGSADVKYNPQTDSAIKADLKMANLVVSDPTGQIPATPLEAKVQVDISMQKQVTDIKQCLVTLTPTQRAKNELNITGHIDATKSTAITGNVKVAADSLDMTTYYDLFGSKKADDGKTTKPVASTSTPGGASPAPSNPNKEPEATTLPLTNFTADVNIGKFYLREVEITNLLTTAKVDGGHVLLNPCKLVLNGAPVSTTADLDLGVPGYKYDLAFSAQAIPVAPLVNSFQPERKGQMGGTLSAQATVKGAGTTGASLQKNLNGQFDVLSTNLNLAVVNIKSPLLKTLINVIAVIPDLAKNPLAAVGSAFGKGGLSDELSKSPLDSVAAKGTMGGGKVHLQQSTVESSAFKADAQGEVAIAEILTNSAIHIPVSVALSQGIAQKLSLVPAGTAPTDKYAKLPDFVTMVGTVGSPKPDIKSSALLGISAKTLGGVASGLGIKSGGLIKSAGDLLSGTPSSTNTTTGTNASAGTNQAPSKTSPVNDLLKDLFKPKKK